MEHCSILPIGAKPCGGPRGYLVYSKVASNESRLKRQIERYDKSDKIRDIEEGLVSACDVAQLPDLTINIVPAKVKGHIPEILAIFWRKTGLRKRINDSKHFQDSIDIKFT